VRGRVIESAVLALLLLFLVLLAGAQLATPPSSHSSFDTGPNGYRALYGVLARENVPVTRLETPLGLRDARIRVLMLTSAAYDANDVRALELFIRKGGTVIAFARIANLHATRTFSGDGYTNLALEKHPQHALDVYDAVAGKGLVAFDEHPYGYDRTQSLWSVLPLAAKAAVWIAVFAVALALVDANVRFAPPIVRDPPAERDSSDYLRSMGALLRRAQAGRTAIERFARAFPKSQELAQLAALTRPSDAQVFRAAALYAELRKERA